MTQTGIAIIIIGFIFSAIGALIRSNRLKKLALLLVLLGGAIAISS